MARYQLFMGLDFGCTIDFPKNSLKLGWENPQLYGLDHLVVCTKKLMIWWFDWFGWSSRLKLYLISQIRKTQFTRVNFSYFFLITKVILHYFFFINLPYIKRFIFLVYVICIIFLLFSSYILVHKYFLLYIQIKI